MKLQLIDGVIFEGNNELDILRAMQAASIFTADYSMDEYIRMLVKNTGIFEHIRLALPIGDLPARARSLIEQLKIQGLAREV